MVRRFVTQGKRLPRFPVPSIGAATRQCTARHITLHADATMPFFQSPDNSRGVGSAICRRGPARSRQTRSARCITRPPRILHLAVGRGSCPTPLARAAATASPRASALASLPLRRFSPHPSGRGRAHGPGSRADAPDLVQSTNKKRAMSTSSSPLSTATGSTREPIARQFSAGGDPGSWHPGQSRAARTACPRSETAHGSRRCTRHPLARWPPARRPSAPSRGR